MASLLKNTLTKEQFNFVRVAEIQLIIRKWFFITIVMEIHIKKHKFHTNLNLNSWLYNGLHVFELAAAIQQ